MKKSLIRKFAIVALSVAVFSGCQTAKKTTETTETQEAYLNDPNFGWDYGMDRSPAAIGVLPLVRLFRELAVADLEKTAFRTAFVELTKKFPELAGIIKNGVVDFAKLEKISVTTHKQALLEFANKESDIYKLGEKNGRNYAAYNMMKKFFTGKNPLYKDIREDLQVSINQFGKNTNADFINAATDGTRKSALHKTGNSLKDMMNSFKETFSDGGVAGVSKADVDQMESNLKYLWSKGIAQHNPEELPKCLGISVGADGKLITQNADSEAFKFIAGYDDLAAKEMRQYGEHCPAWSMMTMVESQATTLLVNDAEMAFSRAADACGNCPYCPVSGAKTVQTYAKKKNLSAAQVVDMAKNPSRRPSCADFNKALAN